MVEQKRELAWLIFQEADCSLSGKDCEIIADLLINKGYRKQNADVVEVRRGEWIRDEWACFYPRYNCSVCGCGCMRIGVPTNFCPHCGADMRGKKDDNRTED